MSSVRFGPAGLGSVKDAVSNLEEYKKLGIGACEIAFTYGIYIKREEDAKEIAKAAEKLGIMLSIHAPYWINLNSDDEEKVKGSKEKIVRCLEVGTWLGAKKVVFHPGFYGKINKEETFEKIKKEIIELQKIRHEKRYTPELAPETTGKVNVFGSIEEIKKLAEETGCSFTIDYAHILAREKDYSFERIKRAFEKFKNWHVHFSGIEYGEKGEKRHKETPEEEFEKIFKGLPKDKEITIINESPEPVKDSLKALNIYRR